MNRYRVVAHWGQVPQQIQEIEGKPDAFLLYAEFRGHISDQGFVSRDEIVGGWSMEYAGPRSVELKESVAT